MVQKHILDELLLQKLCMEEINLPTSIKPTEEPSNMQTYKEDADFSSAFHLQKMSKTMFKNNKAEYRQKMYKKIGEKA